MLSQAVSTNTMPRLGMSSFKVLAKEALTLKAKAGDTLDAISSCGEHSRAMLRGSVARFERSHHCQKLSD